MSFQKILDKEMDNRTNSFLNKGIKGTVILIVINFLNISLGFFTVIFVRDLSFMSLPFLLFYILLGFSFFIGIRNFILLRKSRGVNQLKRNICFLFNILLIVFNVITVLALVILYASPYATK